MIRRILCRLFRHDHTMVHIWIKYRDGGTTASQPMDRWSADHIITNLIAPEAKWAGREVASCRIVVP